MTFSLLGPKDKEKSKLTFLGWDAENPEKTAEHPIWRRISPLVMSFPAGSAQYILEVRLVNKSWPRPCPPKQSTAVTILSGNMMWYHRWLTHRGFPASHHLNMTAFHHPDLFMGESWVRGLTLPPRAQVHGWPSVASISDWACENTHAHPHTQIPFLVEGHFHPDSFLPLA